MSDVEKSDWPDWWDWELDLSAHVLKRMMDRRFNEVDLRGMMSEAFDVHADHEAGRWVVDATHESRPWEVIVEPDETDERLVVITAYPVEAP
jgi:hypothetical protein